MLQNVISHQSITDIFRLPLFEHSHLGGQKETLHVCYGVALFYANVKIMSPHRKNDGIPEFPANFVAYELGQLFL